MMRLPPTTMVIAALALTPILARAQVAGLPFTEGSALHLQLVKPLSLQPRLEVFQVGGTIGRPSVVGATAGSGGFGSTSGVLRADFAFPVRPSTRAYVGVGLTHAAWNDRDGVRRGVALTSPRLGLVHRGDTPTLWEAYLTLPSIAVHGDRYLALDVAEWADPERTGHYQTDVATATVAVQPARQFDPGFGAGVRAGFVAVVEPGAPDSNVDVNLLYGGFMKTRMGPVTLGTGLSGVLYVTSELPSQIGNDRADNEVVLSLEPSDVLGHGQLYLRIPLDRVSPDAFDAVVGLRVTM